MARSAKRAGVVVAVCALAAMGLAACGSTSPGSASTTTNPTTTNPTGTNPAGTSAATATATSKSTANATLTSGDTSGSIVPWTWPGTGPNGYLPPKEPDVDGSGTVKVGLITAGTVHDHGYYQSEVTAIDRYAREYGWTTLVQGKVTPSDALSAAQNMCSQGVDLLVIGESELVAATPAASTPSCKGIPMWFYTSTNVPVTRTSKPYLHIAETTTATSTFATGVAMGIWMKEHHQTTAGFITGPALSFTEGAAQAYLAGIRYVTATFAMDVVYTGTLTASAPAITTAASMIAKGIKMIFPFLGASLFPTAQYITSHGGATPSDGGKWCSHTGVTFAVQEVFDPGYVLDPALTQFAHGRMRVGVLEKFVLGRTSVPAVSFCPTSGVSSNGADQLRHVIEKLESGAITAPALIKATPVPS